MRRGAIGVLALVVVTACSGHGIHTPPTSQPSTTLTSTPVSPTGVADTARRWVAAMATAGQEDAAFAMLAPRSQAAAGGRDGFGARLTELRSAWAMWAKATNAAFDAVPVRADVALVIMHAPLADGSEEASALPMRAVAGEWRPEPLDTVGGVTLSPGERSRVRAFPSLTATVPAGTSVVAFVDGHAADVGALERASAGSVRVTYRPQQGLSPGWHLVSLAFTNGDAVGAAVAHYLVVGTK